MSDLISRSKIRNYIKTQINPYGKPFEGTPYELGLKIMKYIDSMHSAYDIEKVVAELEERSKEYNSGVRLHGKPEEMLTYEAIDIVRKGGVV